jgi:hypothetical protein
MTCFPVYTNALMKINVILLQGEDRGLVLVTTAEISFPDLKIPLSPAGFGTNFLPAAAFPASGQKFSRLDPCGFHRFSSGVV